ncbi:hypothetical protein BH20ACT15_BH20ACT15_03210 [soil metagenome]
MPYTDLEGREGLSARLGEAVEHLGEALSTLGDAYETLDDQTADTLEEKLFGPVQKAYGRAKKTYSDFASRHGLEGRTFDIPASPVVTDKPAALIASVGGSAESADYALTELQDDPAFLEVGDQELRSGVVSVREALARVPLDARLMLRTLGR